MKKLFLSLALMATLLFTACQKEEMNPNAQGASQVTFSVEIPETPQTRAIQEMGENINDLVYAVYRVDPQVTDEAQAIASIANATPMYQINPNAHAFDGGKTNVTIELMNDQNYVILFWAQVSDAWVKGNNFNLQNITYPNPINANDASLAAFSGVSFITNVDGPRSETVTLTRPFAQINVGTTEPVNFNVEFTTSNFKVTNAGANFNVATQEVTGTKSVEFTTAELKHLENITVNSKSYTYVAMNYIFAKRNVDVEFDIATKDHGTVNTSIPNVPVKTNYKTNIVGNLLTSDVKYEVTLDAVWGTPDTDVVIVEDATGLQDAINEAETGVSTEIKLEGDINLSDLFDVLTRSTTDEPQSITIPAGKNVILDLNGYNITSVDETNAAYAIIFNYGNLRVVNSSEKVSKINLKATIESGWSRRSAVISSESGSTLYLGRGVEIEHLGGTSMSYGIDILTNGSNGDVMVTIDGATVKSTYRAIRQFLNSDINNNNLIVKDGSTIQSTTGNKSIWMQDPSAKANKGTLVVEGGANLMTSAYLDVTEGSTEWPVSVSIAASALKGESTVVYENVPLGYKVEEINGIWTVTFNPVAKIGDKGYGTLSAAVAAVKDGETITLVANETFSERNRYNNGGWWDGLGYNGDKSFTIDLGGNTISQDGALNDYLMWFKNDGAKANTITLKNGTLDAGTTAFSAFATASSNAQKITVNFENIILINNISNGAVLKIRGGAEANVKAGTIITGKNSYTGIEAVGNNTVVNIYEGAEIYQKGTSNYVGAIVGASYNATMNIYGGYGKSAKCGIIVMSTGATINVSGGEWIANNDGTVAGDNNAVLVSQNNRYESGWACKSVLNVTGGTFKGGYNCYGMGPGVEADDAQINIKGGNFNADPTQYVEEGYNAVEENGLWNINDSQIHSEDALIEALNNGSDIILGSDITLTKNWTPIGTIDAPYNAVFNGKNHKIIGLKVDNTEYAAFIAYAGKDAVIKNLNLVNVELNSTKHAAGVVCIASEGITLDNVTVSGIINAASYAGGLLHNSANAVIKNCKNAANVTANRAGGIASWVTVNATIENVINEGNILGNVGAAGIAHGFAGKIKNAYNHGNITSNNLEAAAGIVGIQKEISTYEYCFNYGTVTSTFDNANASAAGILGQSAGSKSTLNYCANYGDITAENSYAAGIAYSLYGTVDAYYCFNSGTISGADGAGAIAPKAQYGTNDKANYCLNAGAIISSNGVVYQGSNKNESSYYYDGTSLKNVASNLEITIDDALTVLNSGTDNSFFTTENGKITVK